MDGVGGVALTAEYTAMMERLRATFAKGKTKDFAWRKQQLDALGAAVAANEKKILDALHSDLRKPAAEAVIAEVDYLTKEASLAAKKFERWAKPRKVGTPLGLLPSRSIIVPEPLGVALIIGAWNYPIQEVFGPLIGAIAAGNCAVLKPSELAPASAELLREITAQSLDCEAVATVLGGAEETQALLEQRFDKIFYTGGARVGRLVMKAAAQHLTPVTLELGGKSPAIVAADADLEVAARRIVWGAFLNGGQLCVRPDYCLVDASVYEAFLVEVRKTATAFFGEDMQKSEFFARIVNERHFGRLETLAKSGEAVVGGETDKDDLYVAPTVLRDVKPDAPAMQEEIFGPILPTMPVSSMEEAAAFINGRDKPLALYAFTKSDETADLFIHGTSSGTVMVNDCVTFQANHHLPFGGVGESGMGAFHGQHSFDNFSHLKAVMKRPFFGDVSVRYPPYSERGLKLLRKAM
ncbi:MAG: aldehyde dehydrogenase family protein [Parvularcula sp.]|jgi:acyl-CoA reductase-like NAD-dependent aldehyde dehydrogenase|nr:aldehyde dehydrogenase family protein [Parvularcula sp.]